MAAGVAHHESGLALGRVLGRAFSTIAHNPAVALGIAFLFSALPNLLLRWAVLQTLSGRPLPRSFLLHAGINMVAIMVVSLPAIIGQAALMQVTAADGEGRAARFGEAVGTGLRLLGPLLLLGIFMAVAVTIGCLLLVVPGAILALGWSVAIPALVIEGHGIRTALARSRELTEGSRWRILGLFAIAVFLVIFGAVLIGLVSTAMVEGLTGGAHETLLFSVVITQTLASAFMPTLAASLFLELRARHEGPSRDALAEIFA